MSRDDACASRENVVYLAVQVRKLIELLKLKNEYKTAWFYCNWILHPVKNYEHDTIADMLEELYIDCENELNGIVEERHSNSALQFLEFNSLRSDLVSLFDICGIRANTILDNHAWKSFIINLAGELDGQAIQHKDDNDTGKELKDSPGISNSIRQVSIGLFDENSAKIIITFKKPIEQLSPSGVRLRHTYSAAVAFL